LRCMGLKAVRHTAAGCDEQPVEQPATAQNDPLGPAISCLKCLLNGQENDCLTGRTASPKLEKAGGEAWPACFTNPLSARIGPWCPARGYGRPEPESCAGFHETNGLVSRAPHV
jgi:hypothetical protein